MPRKRRGTRARISPACRQFAEKLTEVRKSRGFVSAYQFYHRGHRKTLPFTYHYYLLIEQGARLPSREALSAIVSALGGVVFLWSEWRELVIRYLNALVDGDPLFARAIQDLRAPAPQTLLDRTANQRVSAIPIMTPEQAEATFVNPTAFWVMQFLLQTGLERTPRQLAVELSLSEGEVSYALRGLVASKLLRVRRDGTYFAPDAATDLAEPIRSLPAARRAWICNQISDRAARTQTHAYGWYALALPSESVEGEVVGFFREALRRAYLTRAPGPVKKGRMITVEYRVTPVVQFG